MNKMFFRVSLSLLLSIVMITSVCAQKKRMPQPKIGLSTTINSTPFITVPFWISKTISIAPMISFSKVDKVGSTFTPGAYIHVHTKKGRIRPYFGGQVMAAIMSPTGGSGTTSISLGGLFGADYYLHPLFSLGIENQLNINLENKDLSIPLSLSTRTVVRATVYIK